MIESTSSEEVPKKAASGAVKRESRRIDTSAGAVQRKSLVIAVIGLGGVLVVFARHAVWVSSVAYSTPAIIVTAKTADGSRIVYDDFRETYVAHTLGALRIFVNTCCTRASVGNV